MMAYIQILAIVLCSCFIQDALSATKVRRVTSAPANDAAASPLESVGGQVIMKPPVRQTSTMKRTVSRKAIAAPSPPPKYPHLTAVKDMFWNTFEDINRADLNGKLGTRSVRNTMSNVLSDELFWSAAVAAIRRRVKVTNNSKRADGKIRMCNALTAIVTSPDSMQSFQDVASEVYGTVSRIQSNVGTDALRLAIEMVDDGEVSKGLDVITNIVKNVNLNPRMLIKGFAMLQKTLNLGGIMNMSGGMTKGLMSFTSNLNI